MTTTAQLLDQKCRPQKDALAAAEIADYLAAIPEWAAEKVPQGERVTRTFTFKDYHQTIAFVNAIADVSNAEDHHPELIVTYNRCVVRFNTHSVNAGRGGLSINDFICAAKVNIIYEALRTHP